MVEQWEIRKIFREAKTIKIVFSSKPGLHYNRLGRGLELFLGFPPGVPVTDSMISRSLSCSPPQYTWRGKIALLILTIILTITVLYLLGESGSGLTWAAVIGGVIALLGAVGERLLARIMGPECASTPVMPTSEYRELVATASRIMVECARRGSCHGTVSLAGRVMRYLAWRPSRFTRLLGLGETVILSVVEEGKGWGGGGVGAG